MKAIWFERYGGPEVLRFGAVPAPKAGPGEVIVEVAAIGVNPADGKWRAGLFAAQVPLTFPHIPGYDLAGREAGTGRRVAAMLDPLRHGAYAERAAVASGSLAEVPDGLSLDLAAALPTPGLTGLQLIEDDLAAPPGQRRLVTGACGMVGRFAVHAARQRGCEVIAAVRADRRDEAIALGADHVVTLGEEAWTGPPIDAVADTVGGAVVADVCAGVRATGAICTVATLPIPGEALRLEPRFCAVRPDSERLSRLLRTVAAGAVPVPIAARMQLEDAAKAHRRLEAGRADGKLILLP